MPGVGCPAQKRGLVFPHTLESMKTALITGASAGIGLEFARQLAATDHHLVLVARDLSRLEDLADALRRDRDITVEVMSADLSDRAALQRVSDRVASVTEPIDLLVNNAGYGLKGSFLKNDIADEERLFDVLTRAVLVLSHAAARAMVQRGHGAIINVSSVASFLASGTYAAEKSFVTVFTEALSNELAGTNVRAMALCPGFTRTEFHGRADLDMTKLPQWMWLDAPDLVSQALADVEKGAVISIPGRQYQAIAAALRVVPRSLVRRTGRSVHRPGPTGRN